MNPANFNTAAVLANIKAIDERYPGSMKDAGIVAMLSSLVTLNSPSTFDPNSIYSIVKWLDDSLLPGSMKKAAIIYLLSQISAGNQTLESGIATLAGGTATVYSANANPANPILLTYYSLNGSGATIKYGNVVSGTSFVISSSSGSDTNKVAWAILKP